jgi:hypothetical protein
MIRDLFLNYILWRLGILWHLSIYVTDSFFFSGDKKSPQFFNQWKSVLYWKWNDFCFYSKTFRLNNVIIRRRKKLVRRLYVLIYCEPISRKTFIYLNQHLQLDTKSVLYNVYLHFVRVHLGIPWYTCSDQTDQDLNSYSGLWRYPSISRISSIYRGFFSGQEMRKVLSSISI